MRAQNIRYIIFLFIWLSASILLKCDKHLEDQGVKLRLERITCKCEPTVCEVQCNVKFVSRVIANLNVNAKILKPLNYIGYHFKTFYKHSNNEYRPMLVDVKDELCDYLGGKKLSIILDVIFKALSTYTNTNKPCPWNPGKYYVKDFNFGIKHWPNLIPEGRYLINITFSGQSNYLIANLQIYFEVTNHGILDLRVG